MFLPVELLTNTESYERVTDSRGGSYWNLVVPYALASGLIPPDSPTAQCVLRYMTLHGSRLLGLVRSRGYRLAQSIAPAPLATDEVYGLQVARFLADNHQADQLDLSLYGTLGAALTPNTFVSGEAASINPAPGSRYRAMYLPPNSGTNATLLETLRLVLVHEIRNASAAPTGLELAPSTPRRWLKPGQTISVENAPTSFGPVSYTLTRRPHSITAVLDLPPTPNTTLHIRLPDHLHITAARATANPVRLDTTTSTIDVTGLTGPVTLTVTLSGRRRAARLQGQ